MFCGYPLREIDGALCGGAKIQKYIQSTGSMVMGTDTERERERQSERAPHSFGVDIDSVAMPFVIDTNGDRE